MRLLLRSNGRLFSLDRPKSLDQRIEGDAVTRAFGEHRVTVQFLKTMQAPPVLRISAQTASASARVWRPMRAV